MAVTGVYICDCGERFQGTFGDDEEAQCSRCKGEVPTGQQGSEFDLLKPPSMEDLTSIPYT